MSRDSDLLFAALALHGNWVAREQLRDCAPALESDPARGLPDLLCERGFLRPEERDALAALAAAHAARFGGGDPARGLTELGLEDEIRGLLRTDSARSGNGNTLLRWSPAAREEAAPDPGDVRKAFASGEATIAGDGGEGQEGAASPAPLRRAVADRYEFRGELGRGGLGRVLEAVDRDFGRDVAVKVMLHAQSGGEAVERFLLEGRVAGRLPHPNIVPVYEIGEMRISDGGGTESRPFFTMAKIEGRDLGKILRAVERGTWESVERAASSVEKPEASEHSPLDTRHSSLDTARDPRKEFSLHRLLRIFQDVCNAVAYAHDHGVLHRDLKPANVMVGDYGEVYVVDWGLSKIAGGPATSDRSDRSDPSDLTAPTRDAMTAGPALTLEGEILGTPAYMPPEQAAGRVSEIDRRSDIYSLGAILYEILTFRPPFEGQSAVDVLSQVISGELVAPSRKSSIARPPGPVQDPDAASSAVPGSGAEVSASPSAGGSTGAAPLDFRGVPVPPELDAIVLQALSRDKAKRHASARELSDAIQVFLEGEKEKERKRLEAAERVKRGREGVARYLELRRKIDEKADEVGKIEEGVRPWAGAEEKRAFWKAQDDLQALREERVAEYGRAEVAFGQALQADPSNPGGGEGRCELYLDRYFEAEKARNREDMLLFRNLIAQYDKDGSWRARIDEPGALSLRTFAYPCACLRPVAHPEWRVEFGEEPVVAWREGRPVRVETLKDLDRPVPATRTRPEGARFGHVPSCGRREVRGAEATLHRYEERDRRLVPGPGRVVGTTPIERVTVEQGSYLCVLRKEGFRDLRLPVRVTRKGTWDQEVNLYAEPDVPPGFLPIPGGPFTAGGDDNPDHVVGWETQRTADCFMAADALTFAEYIEFLDALSARKPEEARARQPREGGKTFLLEREGRWRVPEAGEAPFPIALDMPVVGVSWFDALAYCAWRSSSGGRIYTLPHEEEYEKAARGVDGRMFPWGDVYDSSFSNTLQSHAEGPRLRAVGSFPVDTGPYGVRDLAGNAVTWTWNAPEKVYRHSRLFKGSAWSLTRDAARACNRRGQLPQQAIRTVGIRLVVRAFAPEA